MISILEKRCTGCNLTKTASEFSKNSQMKDGLAKWCRICYASRRSKLNYPVSVDHKLCRKCKNVKPASEFKSDRRISDGLKSWCNRCDLNSRYALKKTEYGRMKTRKNSYSILRFSHSKNKAKRRCLEWSISRDEFKELAKQPCHYCGDNIITTGSGLDRVDNTKGYVVGNVVPCCNICNTMKLDYWTYEEMLRLGALAKELKLVRKQLPSISDC